MKETLSVTQIADRLHADENAGWSYAGARALAEYLDELDGDLGEDTELDVVAIRCDWSEYESLQDFAEEYFGGMAKALDTIGVDDEPTDEEIDDAIRDWIQDNAALVEFNGGIIVSSF